MSHVSHKNYWRQLIDWSQQLPVVEATFRAAVVPSSGIPIEACRDVYEWKMDVSHTLLRVIVASKE